MSLPENFHFATAPVPRKLPAHERRHPPTRSDPARRCPELLPLVYAELRALARAKMPAGTLTTPLRDGTLAPQTHLP